MISQREEPLKNERLSGKVIFLSLETLGIFAGVFALLIGLRSLLSPLRAKIASQPGFVPAALGEAVSTLRWGILCVVTVILVLVVRRISRPWSLSDVGFRIHRGLGKDAWYGIVIFSLSYLVTLPIFISVLPFKASLAGQSYLKGMTQLFSSASLILPAVIILLVSEYTGAFWEEVFWRGYVQTLFSQEVAPVAGFLSAAMFFGLGHYFTRPEWGALDVLIALMGGLFMGLVYYATGSIYISAVVHALSNAFWTYPFVAYLQGSGRPARAFMFGLGVLCLALVGLGRREVAHFLNKARELFARSRPGAILVGFLLGLIFLFYDWGQSLLIKGVNRKVFIGVLSGFAVVAMGLSLFWARSQPGETEVPVSEKHGATEARPK